MRYLRVFTFDGGAEDVKVPPHGLAGSWELLLQQHGLDTNHVATEERMLNQQQKQIKSQLEVFDSPGHLDQQVHEGIGQWELSVVASVRLQLLRLQDDKPTLQKHKNRKFLFIPESLFSPRLSLEAASAAPSEAPPPMTHCCHGECHPLTSDWTCRGEVLCLINGVK